MANLRTLGQIAREANVSFARAKHALERSGVEPAGRAGIIRLFNDEQATAIRSMLTRIASDRADRQASAH